MTDDLVVILTALDLEFQAVAKLLTDLHPQSKKDTIFEVGTVPGTKCRVALAETGKGNAVASFVTEQAIDLFSPVALLFVGVAGALRDSASLGDVVVATHTYGYHGGTSEDDGFKARPRVWEAPYAVSQLARYLARNNDWTSRLPAGSPIPRVLFGPIAAGEIVQNSRSSYEAQLLQNHYNDALAIEMEGAGVAEAGHLSDSPVAIVRGISDRADGTKNSCDDRDWQPLAARNAAAFAVRLAEELINKREQITMHDGSNDKDRGNVHSVHNIAFGGNVGVQAGQIFGGVHMTSPEPAPSPSVSSLVGELAAFRYYLLNARSADRLDELTYQGALSEIDSADRALKTGTSGSKAEFLLSLKRLSGLVSDVSDLAARVAVLITAAKGVS